MSRGRNDSGRSVNRSSYNRRRGSLQAARVNLGGRGEGSVAGGGRVLRLDAGLVGGDGLRRQIRYEDANVLLETTYSSEAVLVGHVFDFAVDTERIGVTVGTSLVAVRVTLFLLEVRVAVAVIDVVAEVIGLRRLYVERDMDG